MLVALVTAAPVVSAADFPPSTTSPQPAPSPPRRVIASPPASSSLASRFIGTWKLIAIRDRDPATGKENPAARAADDGLLIYAANGRLSVQIVRKRARELRQKAPPTALAQLLRPLGATRRRELRDPSPGRQSQLRPGRPGRQALLLLRHTEGHLSLATPPSKRDDDHVTSTVFVWEKIP